MNELAIDTVKTNGKLSSIKIKCPRSKKILHELEYVEKECTSGVGEIISKQYREGVVVGRKIINYLK